MTSENQKKTIRYWGIRLGGGGKFVEYGRKGRYIAIGWEKFGNLAWLADKERSESEVWNELTKQYRNLWGGSEIQVGQACGQVIKFVRKIKEDDIVAIPDMARGRVLLGRVTGLYEYKEDWGDGCPFQHRRKVEWIKDVRRDAIPTKLKTGLGSLLTLFSLDRYKHEITPLIGGPVPDTEEVELTGDKLAKATIERLFNLRPDQFESFITHLLTLVGFEAATTKYVGDKGVDVIGTLSPEGLTNITLNAQVKRVRGNIGIGSILMLKGTLGPDEHGVLITTGGFTKQAQREAEAEGKKPIALMDGGMLVDLILSHYDELDDVYKDLLQLRKREVPIRERFYITIKR